jgi:ankyrin repeat protein
MASRRTLLPALAALAGFGCGGGLDDPLVAAARAGRAGEIRRLAREGVSLARPAGVNGWTPLMHAIHKHRPEAVAALLDAGADPDGPCCGGMTPLMMAAGYGQTEIVKLLLARGADARRRGPNGETALEKAVTGVADIDAFTLGACQVSTVKALLESAPDAPVAGSLAGRAYMLKGPCPAVRQLLATVAR